MRIVIAWIVGALFIGFLGRNRRAGFWGNLFFSLLFSPLIGALALVLAGPSGQEKDKQRRAVRAAAGQSQLARDSAFQAVLMAILVPWLFVVGLFGVAYWIAIGSSPEQSVLVQAFQLSLATATMGLSSLDPGAVTNTLRVLMGIERLAVLVILAAAIVRVVALSRDARFREMRAAQDQASEAVRAVETANRGLQEDLNRLRAAGQSSAPAKATASATVTH
jgi:hypothetical protein